MRLEKAYEHNKEIRRSQGTLIELRKKHRNQNMLGPVIGILAIIVAILIAVLK